MEKWYNLDNFRCPVTGCEGGKIPCRWICEFDNTLIQIAQTGYMKCSHNVGGRAAHYGQICMWRWDCGRHGDHPYKRFQDIDFQGFVFALSHAVQLTTTAGATWVATLCGELNKQYAGMEEKTPDSNSNRICSICKDRNVDAFLSPCGHTICMEDGLELQKDSNQCHLCRKTFTSVNKLYF